MMILSMWTHWVLVERMLGTGVCHTVTASVHCFSVTFAAGVNTDGIGQVYMVGSIMVPSSLLRGDTVLVFW